MTYISPWGSLHLLCLLANFLAGVYGGQWRLITISDMPSYAGAVIGGIGSSLVLITMISRFEPGHSRSAYIIFGLLLFLALTASRLSFRFLDYILSKYGSNPKAGLRTPVLIYGAGKAGKLLHEEVTFNVALKEFAIIGFIDDDSNKTGHRLCGLPVKHPKDWLKRNWDVLPEIWVSSRFITNDQAKNLAGRFEWRPVVCRLRLQIDPITTQRDQTGIQQAIKNREKVTVPEERPDVIFD